MIHKALRKQVTRKRLPKGRLLCWITDIGRTLQYGIITSKVESQLVPEHCPKLSKTSLCQWSLLQSSMRFPSMPNQPAPQRDLSPPGAPSNDTSTKPVSDLGLGLQSLVVTKTTSWSQNVWEYQWNMANPFYFHGPSIYHPIIEGSEFGNMIETFHIHDMI